MENVLNIKSRKNDNIYHVFDEKIVVTIGAKTKDIVTQYEYRKRVYGRRLMIRRLWRYEMSGIAIEDKRK